MATVTDRPERKRRLTEQLGRPRESPSPPHPLAPFSAVLAGLFALVAVILAIALNLGSGPSPPATGAATVVPADTLLYLHVSTDSSRPGVPQALARVQRLPGAALLIGAVTGKVDAILSGSSSGSVDFATDIRPWLGREAAFAVLDTAGASAGTLVVLDVRDRARATAFLAAHGATSAGSYRHVALLHEPSGTTLAFLAHYLVVGQAASVEAAIDVSRGSRSLAQSTAYKQAAAGEPDGRVVDFYAPGAGVARALLPSTGLLGALGVLLDQPALRASTCSISPTGQGFAVRIHSTLEPSLARAGATRTRSITPSLASVLPAGSTMLLDGPNLRGAAAKLLGAAARVGIAGRAAGLLARLGSALVSQGVSLKRLFGIFGPEAGLAIVPGGRGSGPVPVLVGRNAHPAAALAELSSLEGPLTVAFTPPTGSGGLVPEVAATSVGGVTVSQLTLAPGLQLDWAVSRGLVVLSTSAGAVAGVISHRASLSAQRSYRTAVGGVHGPVTSLLFLDLGPLLRLGSRLGLISGNVLAALLPDLEQAGAIGVASTTGHFETTTQLQLQIR